MYIGKTNMLLRHLLLISTSIVTLSSCSVLLPNSDFKNNNINIQKKIKYSINGKVEFPELKFKTKALYSDIATNGTVSIIDPYNNVVATALTDNDGNFDISPNDNFYPYQDNTYILEATRRIGDVGNNIMSLRTIILWNGLYWESITHPGVYINTKTTAISLINTLKGGSANYFINTVDTSGETSIPSDLGSTASIQEINDLSQMVKDILSENKDPFALIKYDGRYYIDNSYNVGRLTQYRECVNCDLRNLNLSASNFINVNLNQAKLINTNLSYSDMRGSNFSNANLSNVNFSEAILEALYPDSEDSRIVSNFSNANLENVNFTKADLSYANLKDANISGANFTDTNLSNATWIDGRICNEDSFGTCN
jgi:hypothetical protein